jgi:hypothetical protein
MPTNFTEGRHAASFVLIEAEGQFSRETITIASGAGVVKAGTVLGKVTASGKYVPSPATGADGSQVGAAVALYEVDATSADVETVAVARHTIVNSNLLFYAASVNDNTKKATKNAELKAIGIVVR